MEFSEDIRRPRAILCKEFSNNFLEKGGCGAASFHGVTLGRCSLTAVEMSRVQCPSTALPSALDTNTLYPWQGFFMDAIDGLPE